MIEEILKGLYKLEIPLPGNPLRSVNSYVIITSDRNLIIDTGMNRRECMKAMELGLKELGVDIEKTDFYITHSHSDHLGLAHSRRPRACLLTRRAARGRIMPLQGWPAWRRPVCPATLPNAATAVNPRSSAAMCPCDPRAPKARQRPA